MIGIAIEVTTVCTHLSGNVAKPARTSPTMIFAVVIPFVPFLASVAPMPCTGFVVQVRCNLHITHRVEQFCQITTTYLPGDGAPRRVDLQ